ncbi:MAG: hypothetical protein ACRBFS_07800 [Aureispira sp.]
MRFFMQQLFWNSFYRIVKGLKKASKLYLAVNDILFNYAVNYHSTVRSISFIVHGLNGF